MIELGGKLLCWAISPKGRCRNALVGNGQHESGYCAECYYPGITEDHDTYNRHKREGYSHIQSAIKAGLLDPSE